MDTTGFFQYPGEPALPQPEGFLGSLTAEEWDIVLAFTETRRFRPDEIVVAEGEHDRALYLLVDGRLEGPNGIIEPVGTFGEAAFLDGRPRAVTLHARSHGEALRLGYEAFEALAAREPRLARAVLEDLARVLAQRLRTTTSFTG